MIFNLGDYLNCTKFVFYDGQTMPNESQIQGQTNVVYINFTAADIFRVIDD